MEEMIKLYKELSILSNKPNRIVCKDLYRQYFKNEFEAKSLELLLKYKDKKVADFFTKKNLELHKHSKNYLNSDIIYDIDNTLCIIESELLRIIRFEILCKQQQNIENHLQELEKVIHFSNDNGKILYFILERLNKSIENKEISDIKDSIDFFKNNILLKSVDLVEYDFRSIKIYIKRIEDFIKSYFDYYKLQDQ